MILTDYYKMAKLPTCKSKMRMDCIASTGSYEPFEARATRTREKRFKFYFGDTPEQFKAEAKRKSGMAISDGSYISSVYVPDLENPLMGYGDMVGTQDALLFLFTEDYRSVEVFVARGLKNNKNGLFNKFTDGELGEEVKALRERATPTNAEG